VLTHCIKWFGHPRKFQGAKIRYASVNVVRTFSVLPAFRCIGKTPKVDCEFRHVAIRFSVRTEQLPLLRIFWILIFEDFSKSCRENSIYIKSYNTNVYLHEDRCIFMVACRWILLRTRNLQKIKAIEKIRTHILCSITFFFFLQKIVLFWDNVEKCGRARQSTDDRTIQRK